MGISFGEINATQILENEYKVKLMARIFDLLLAKNPGLNLTQDEINGIKESVESELQDKYPKSGIRINK